MANRKYTESQRAEAIRLISVEGQSATSVARELSVSVGTVHRWVSDAMAARTADPTPGRCPESIGDWPEQLDLESQLRCVIHRLDRLESRMQELSQGEFGRENGPVGAPGAASG